MHAANHSLNANTTSGLNFFKEIDSVKGFKMACLNITSLIKHIDELRLIMTSRPFDILVINETRLDDSINDSEVSLAGYQVIRNDRNRNGGGVAMYVKDSIGFIEKKMNLDV